MGRRRASDFAKGNELVRRDTPKDRNRWQAVEITPCYGMWLNLAPVLSSSAVDNSYAGCSASQCLAMSSRRQIHTASWPRT